MDVPINGWVRWLADAPAVFDAIPEGFPGGTVRVRAVVADLFGLHGAVADNVLLQQFEPRDRSDAERERLRAVLRSARVLSHPTVRGAPESGLRALLIDELRQWSAVVAGNAANDERREELARRCLRAIGRRPAGESPAEAEDRLRQVDVIERAKVLRQAADREARARQVREALAKAAAEEAAARAGRE